MRSRYCVGDKPRGNKTANEDKSRTYETLRWLILRS